MSNPDTLLKSAIDEAIEPLVADYHTYLANAEEAALPIARADLHYLYDQYGTQMLDFSASMAPVGHKHPYVHDAIKEHMGYYMRTAAVGEHILRWPVEYARALVDTFTPEESTPVHQVLFTEGEREAVLVAIDMARQLSDGYQIAAVDTDVHNWVTSYSHDTMKLLPVDEFWLNDFRWENTCCLLVSLVTADGRVLEPRWIQEVSNMALSHQVPVIIDESLSGFGRLGGNMWGQDRLNVSADITVLGGPVGGGLALGAVITAAEQFKRVGIDVSPQAGSPVACCAGAGTLRAINPGVLTHVLDTGRSFGDHLTQLVEQFPEFVVTTHGTGYWQTLEFQDARLAHRFETDVRTNGLLVAHPVGSSVILTPTLITSSMEIKRGMDLIADTLLTWQEIDLV